MKTVKLYETDAYIKSFEAVVLSCKECDGGYKTVLTPVYDEKIAAYFVPYISEMKPILPQECWYFVLGAFEIVLLFRLFKCKNFGYIALYTLFFIYLPFAVLIRRFLPYGILFYVMINSLLLVELFKHLSLNDKYKLATLACIVLNLFFSLSFFYNVMPKSATYPKLNGCALTDIFFAPQLIYKTGITTIGSPYHRNIEGISDAIEIFSETNEEIIKKRLRKRNVKYVVISDELLEYLQNTPEDSFYKNLLKRNNYKWLKTISDKNNSVLFFEVAE